MDFVRTVFASTAVTTALICATTWFARTLIKERLSRSIKHEYDIDLEKYRSRLSSSTSVEIEQFKARIGAEYEIIKASLLRYSEKQFDLYNDLWASLCDLEVCVSNLWDVANINNLRKLSQQLHYTRLKVRKSALLIEDRHYKEINLVISEFESFEFGKQNLINLRKIRQNQNNEDFDECAVRSAISKNAAIKNRLVEILAAMMACLKNQIVKSDCG